MADHVYAVPCCQVHVLCGMFFVHSHKLTERTIRNIWSVPELQVRKIFYYDNRFSIYDIEEKCKTGTGTEQ